MTRLREYSLPGFGPFGGEAMEPRPPRGGRRGAALVLVLLLLAVMTVLLAEFQFNLKVQTVLFHNQEELAQARYVAIAGVHAGEGLIQYTTLEKESMYNNQMIQAYQWKCLSQPIGPSPGTAGGSTVRTSGPGQGDTSTEMSGCGAWSLDVPYEMNGVSLDMHIYDEQARINLNALYKYSIVDTQRQLVTDQLMRSVVFELFEYEMVKHDIQMDISLDELIDNGIMDYIDGGMVNGSFDQDKYSHFEYEDSDRVVPMKDGPFDTVGELKVVPWISDEFFDSVKDFLTVYPMNQSEDSFNGKINLNTCSVEVLYAVLRAASYKNGDPTISVEDAYKAATEIINTAFAGGAAAQQGSAKPTGPLTGLSSGSLPSYNRTIPPEIRQQCPLLSQIELANIANVKPRYYRIESTAFTEDALEMTITRVVKFNKGIVTAVYYNEN